jgi:hypothetical protein
LADTVTIAATHYGILFKLWVDLDVGSEADLEALPDSLTVSVTIGSLVFSTEVHPLVEHTDGNSVIHRTVDLGPWAFTFWPDGLYSGTAGDDIVFAVDSAGTGVKSKVNYLYSD